MPNYSTVSDGTAASSGSSSSSSSSSSSRRNGGDDMTRHGHRRPRGGRRDGGYGHGYYSGGGGGQASMLSSVINLLNTIVGAGTLAMPSAMSHFGVVLGVAVIVWSAFTSAFGLYLQSRCARYLDRGSSSFFALSQQTYPNAAVLFDAAIAVKCFGVGVSYLIIIGDLMPGVAQAFGAQLDGTPFLLDRNFWMTAFMLVIIPLSFLRRLDSLKYTSVVALVSIGYLIVLVVYHYAADAVLDRGPVRVVTWNGPIAALSTLPVVIFAYTCHQNMFSILNELENNSPQSVMAVIGSSIGSAAGIYILVAITGYLTFGDHVQSNIVSMYGSNVASTIAKAAMVVLVTFSVPLQIHPCRASIDAVLKWRPNAVARAGGRGGNTALSPLPLLPTAQAALAHSDHHVAPMSDLRFALLTTIILIAAYSTALSVLSLARVLAYVGATGSTSISFILPGLFYYKISDPDSCHHQRLAKEDDDIASPVRSDLGPTDEAEAEAEDEHDEDGRRRAEGARGVDDEEGEDGDAAAMAASTVSVRSNSNGSSGGSGGSGNRRRAKGSARRPWRWRRRWRWDMEHLSHALLRKGALMLAVYGFVVMVTCLVMNMFMTVGH